jgi:pimeloyl-ACP methyl ester carboxylesterase
MKSADGASVVLVHGLWMNGLAMLPLARRLEHCGFRVARHGYKSVSRGLSENARLLAVACEMYCAKKKERVHLVGHSLGGLVIMTMLQEHAHIPVNRVVLLGTPYLDSAAAHGLERFEWGSGILGHTIRDWLRQPRPRVPYGLELGVIAGDVAFGLGRLFVTLPAANDGVVMVDETRVPGAADSIVLHTSHSAMLISPAVARAACSFLQEGRFKQ